MCLLSRFRQVWMEGKSHPGNLVFVSSPTALSLQCTGKWEWVWGWATSDVDTFHLCSSEAGTERTAQETAADPVVRVFGKLATLPKQGPDLRYLRGGGPFGGGDFLGYDIWLNRTHFGSFVRRLRTSESLRLVWPNKTCFEKKEDKRASNINHHINHL